MDWIAVIAKLHLCEGGLVWRDTTVVVRGGNNQKIIASAGNAAVEIRMSRIENDVFILAPARHRSRGLGMPEDSTLLAAFLAGCIAAGATMLGTLPALFAHSLGRRLQDAMLGFVLIMVLDTALG